MTFWDPHEIDQIKLLEDKLYRLYEKQRIIEKYMLGLPYYPIRNEIVVTVFEINRLNKILENKKQEYSRATKDFCYLSDKPPILEIKEINNAKF